MERSSPGTIGIEEPVADAEVKKPWGQFIFIKKKIHI